MVDKPDWILIYVWDLLADSISRFSGWRGFCEAVEKLLTDPSLKPTWGRLNAVLESIDPHVFRREAAEYIVGSFCNPLLLYSFPGAAHSPTPKQKLLRDRNEAESHLQTASKHLMKAVGEIQKSVQISRNLPDEARTIAGMVICIFVEAGHEDAITLSKIPDNFWIHARGLKTAAFLEELAARLTPGDDPWADVPGMQSNKATWRDWLREAEANLSAGGRQYGKDFSLREADWVCLAKSLIDPAISRNSVSAALRN